MVKLYLGTKNKEHSVEIQKCKFSCSFSYFKGKPFLTQSSLSYLLVTVSSVKNYQLDTITILIYVPV